MFVTRQRTDVETLRAAWGEGTLLPDPDEALRRRHGDSGHPCDALPGYREPRRQAGVRARPHGPHLRGDVPLPGGHRARRSPDARLLRGGLCRHRHSLHQAMPRRGRHGPCLRGGRPAAGAGPLERPGFALRHQRRRADGPRRRVPRIYRPGAGTPSPRAVLFGQESRVARRRGEVRGFDRADPARTVGLSGQPPADGGALAEQRIPGAGPDPQGGVPTRR